MAIRLRRRRAFSLLEVLAAVAILGIVYMFLASVTIEGLRSEGQSEQRLRAALLADLRLAEHEAAMATGAPCPEPSGPDEVDGFEVLVEVQRLELPSPPEDANATAAPSRGARLPTPGIPIEQSPLCELRVIVRLPEDVGDFSLSRSTFVFDQIAWDALAAGAVPDVGATP